MVTKVTDLAERANVVLASKDAIIYPDAEEYYLYSNQWIPLMENCTIQEKVRLGSILDKMCGGGFQVTAGFRPVANQKATKTNLVNLAERVYTIT